MTHYYYDGKELREIDRMPPHSDYEWCNCHYCKKFRFYLSESLPVIPSSGFTKEGVYTEDQIDWRYEVLGGYGYRECNKEEFDLSGSPKRKVAILKPSLPNLDKSIAPSPETDEDAARIYAKSEGGGSAEEYTNTKAFLRGCNHVRAQQGDADYLLSAIKTAISYRDFGVLTEIVKKVEQQDSKKRLDTKSLRGE